MTDAERPKDPSSKTTRPVAGQSPPGSEPGAPVSQEPSTPLSKEEQMARFEEQLKEDDWGHQPC